MDFVAKYFDELNVRQVYEILRSRTEIFSLEQNIMYQDMDRIDYICRHCFFETDEGVTAYLRAFYADETREVVKIGRVLTLDHGKGVGRLLLENSINDINSNMKCKKIILNAQKHAIAFYEKFGFTVVGEEFVEEGIIHAPMELNLKSEGAQNTRKPEKT